MIKITKEKNYSNAYILNNTYIIKKHVSTSPIYTNELQDNLEEDLVLVRPLSVDYTDSSKLLVMVIIPTLNAENEIETYFSSELISKKDFEKQALSVASILPTFEPHPATDGTANVLYYSKAHELAIMQYSKSDCIQGASIAFQSITHSQLNNGFCQPSNQDPTCVTAQELALQCINQCHVHKDFTIMDVLLENIETAYLERQNMNMPLQNSSQDHIFELQDELQTVKKMNPVVFVETHKTQINLFDQANIDDLYDFAEKYNKQNPNSPIYYTEDSTKQEVISQFSAKQMKEWFMLLTEDEIKNTQNYETAYKNNPKAFKADYAHLNNLIEQSEEALLNLQKDYGLVDISAEYPLNFYVDEIIAFSPESNDDYDQEDYLDLFKQKTYTN